MSASAVVEKPSGNALRLIPGDITEGRVPLAGTKNQEQHLKNVHPKMYPSFRIHYLSSDPRGHTWDPDFASIVGSSRWGRLWPLFWADLGGPQIHPLYFYLFPAGIKNTKYPRTCLRIASGADFGCNLHCFSIRSPSQGSRGPPWAPRDRKTLPKVCPDWGRLRPLFEPYGPGCRSRVPRPHTAPALSDPCGLSSPDPPGCPLRPW
jgi:hypothetical protein